jgi:hypothetical protein
MNSFRSTFAGSVARPFAPRIKLYDKENPKNIENLNYARDLYRYQILYDKVLYEMKTYLTLFTNGSFQELKTVFTESKYRSLLTTNVPSTYYNKNVTDLKNFKYSPSLFQNYKNDIYSVLTGFSLAIKQNEKLEIATNELTTCAELLSSKDKLIEYIRTELSDTMMMETFRISQTYNAQAVLKPWYMKYLEMYGAPYDGVFNSEKMATVVELLIQEKVITMEDFLQNQSSESQSTS